MSIKNLIIAAAALTVSSAFAQEFVDQTRFTGSKTRAEVVAEIQGAKRGTAGNAEYVEAPAATKGKTRTEVRAELERDVASGNYAASHAEFVEFSNIASSRSREEVRAEVIQAAQARRFATSGN